MENTENSSKTTALVTSAKSYIDRVLNNDAARKGIAAAGAGILVAAITEALWPSSR